MQGQSVWAALAIATVPGVLLVVAGWLAKRRLENAQASAATSTAAIDGFDKLVNRLQAELARRDTEIKELRAQLDAYERRKGK